MITLSRKWYPMAEVTQAPAPAVPLRRNLAFQTLWIGQTAASLGVSVADVAYPLAILAITGSPARAGLFGAVQAAGGLLAGLPAGSLADRHDPRAIVIIAEACRAMVTVAVVTALVTGEASLPLLLAAAAVLGVGASVSGSARLLLVRSVVPPDQLTRALTQDEVRQSGAALIGPAAGGALYAVRALSHAVPFLFTAGCFVMAVLTAAVIKLIPGPAADRATGPQRRPGSPEPAGEGSDRGMTAGLRVIWRQPALRLAMLLIMAANTMGAGMDLVVIVILHHQKVPSAQIGLALGLGAVGGLAGAPLVKMLHRLPPGVLLLSVCTLWVPLFALIAVPLGPWWVAFLLFAAMLCLPAIRVTIDILVIRRAPAQVRGRVVAALMTLISLGVPVGMAGCGLLLQYLRAQAAMLVLAAVLLAAVGYCSARPELWQARWPDDGPRGAG
jgi:predicted MFS family arabinose efflux permease